MKHLKKVTAGIVSALLCVSAVSASAQEMELYVRDQYVVRDVVSRSGFDMLPIADIAGELGFTYIPTYFGFYLRGAQQEYTFTMGSPKVFDAYGNETGLDIVPMWIDGKIRIPSSFITKTLGMSYTWDYVTNIIFIDSDSSFNDIRYSYWYNGWKRAADKAVECYPGTIVPDYGNLSVEAATGYNEYDGWTEYYYPYYESDFIRYIEYLDETGWEEFEDPYIDDTSIVFYFFKYNVSINAEIYSDEDLEFVAVRYIAE